MSDALLPAIERPRAQAMGESGLVKGLLIGTALLFLTAFLFLPLITVFLEGFRKGAGVFFDSFSDPDTMAAVKLTLLVAAIAVPFNALVGIAASWPSPSSTSRGKTCC